MNALTKTICSFIVLLLAFACSESSPPADTAGYEFFPLENGLFWVFNIQETTYTLTNIPATKSYQIKEKIAETFEDLSKNTTFRLERFKRNSENDVWVLDSVFTVKKNTDKIVRTENNLSFIKLIFPIRETLRWNADTLNNLGRDLYEMRKIDKSFGNFDKTITIIQQNDSTLVSQDKRTEIYARNVGLVFKENIQLSFCSQPNCLGKYQIDFGKKISFKIKNYGKE